jgi:hypothetical protein
VKCFHSAPARASTLEQLKAHHAESMVSFMSWGRAHLAVDLDFLPDFAQAPASTVIPSRGFPLNYVAAHDEVKV